MNIITQRSSSGKHTPIHVQEFSAGDAELYGSTKVTTGVSKSKSAGVDVGQSGAALNLGLQWSQTETHEGTECVTFQGGRVGDEWVQWTWIGSTVNHLIGERKFWMKIPITKKQGVTACFIVRCVMGHGFFGKDELKFPKKCEMKYETITSTP